MEVNLSTSPSGRAWRGSSRSAWAALATTVTASADRVLSDSCQVTRSFTIKGTPSYDLSRGVVVVLGGLPSGL